METIKCPECGETGKESCVCTGGTGSYPADDCPVCGGTGVMSCTDCGGSGQIDNPDYVTDENEDY